MMKVKNCWRILLCVDVIGFFETWRCRNIRKIDANSSYWRRKSSMIWKSSEIKVSMKLSRICLMIILKVTKMQGFTFSIENKFLKKPQRESSWPQKLSLPKIHFFQLAICKFSGFQKLSVFISLLFLFQ